MQLSVPNEHGVYESSTREMVARQGRSYAAVNIALCEDGLYRIGLDLHYSYGGFCFPICVDSQGFTSLVEARVAGLESLLARWPRPFPSDPRSVCEELAELHRQVKSHLVQPSLF